MTRFAPSPCGGLRIALCDVEVMLRWSGAMWLEDERTLVVADLHFEKGSSYAARFGQMLPPYDTRETLMKLAAMIDHYNPETVIALGDSLHDPDGAARMDRSDVESLHMLQEDRDWIWITGNHDPKIDRMLAGYVLPEIVVEGIALRHEPRPGRVTHEVAGHLHPAAKVSVYGHTVRRPCFVGNGRRLVMPAFGAYTGGLNILDLAFEPLRGLGDHLLHGRDEEVV